MSALDGEVSEQALLVGLAQDVLLDCGGRHQPVHVHVARLPDAVAPVLRLRTPTNTQLKQLRINEF